MVIQKRIRERLGVGPGWRVLQRLVGNRVELVFLPPEDKSLKGILAPYTAVRVGDEAWPEAKEAAWRASLG
ncbi:AbrB family transcriptional regulator [Thermus sediminis]|uniref:AbrB family transcriptional regulator n=1 Tax=Thermus sediminis TaxID=1761908 RepID=UPI000E3E368E|nr:AbrB family transcriptional regulator [Thermus sediminis]